MSKRFKIALFIRFVGYFVFLLGIVVFFSVFGPLVKAEAGYRFDKARGVKRVVPNIITSNPDQSNASSSFAQLNDNTEVIQPIDTNFGIVIEKINANAHVIPNVDPGNEKAYYEALAHGVVHAAGTNLPGEIGNIYLFSHSTDAPWNVARYNAIFYLLRELVPGDRVIIFYQGRRYDYIVFDKIIAEPNDLSYLTNRYTESVLTLQTCDPPGTTLKRLIVRAKLQGS